jgi:hypothetical protein
MTLEPGFWTAILAALSGLALTVGLERFLQTAASLRRPAAAWALHIGLYGLAYVVLVFVLGRPIFATALLCAFFLLLVVVSNAKFKALREAFVFQDYEYFTDAIRHPRLYIPFLGWGKVLPGGSGLYCRPDDWLMAGSRARFAGCLDRAMGSLGSACCVESGLAALG